MLFLPKSRDTKCGDVGWIGIQVTNEIAPFTYIPSHKRKISKYLLIKD